MEGNKGASRLPTNIATKVLFVTGKGGVGKSSIALAYGLGFAAQGLRTLVVEMGSQSYFADFLNLPQLSHQPTTARPNLDLVCWTGEQCLREYALHYLKLERLYNLFFENRVMRALVDVAPGLREISLLGKITSGIRHVGPDFNYERIVVDCFATGHALALFRAPRGLAQSIQVGPMGEQSRSIDQVLRDPALCSYKIVTLLEELPITETFELAQGLQEVLGVNAEVIINKALHPPLIQADLARLGDMGISASINKNSENLSQFARYLSDICSRQNCHRHQLTAAGQLAGEVRLHFSSDPWRLIEDLQRDLQNHLSQRSSA